MKNLFDDRTFYRKLFLIALPITLQSLMLSLVAAGDAVMLGYFDQDSMSAVSLATQVQFIQNMLLWAIVSVIGILGAQYWGNKNFTVLDEIFGMSVRFSFIVSIIFFAACFFFPYYLMRLFANDENLINLGIEYLKIASWSYLLTGVSQCYLAMMKISEHASRAAWISSGAVVINIVLNAVFIFGLLGVPAMSVRGAAIATVLARVIELLWCVFSSYEKTFIRLRIRYIFYFNKLLAFDFLRCGLPILGASIFWGIGFTSYTAIMGQLGSDSAAANSVAAVARDIICCLCNGVYSAVGIVIGNELGAGNLEKGKEYGERSFYCSFIVGFISSLLILVCLPLVLSFMKLTEQAREYMIGMFLILSIYMIGRCVCTIVINGIFSAGGDTLFDVYSLIVFMWGLALPCAFLGAFYFHIPVLLVYACTCLDEVGKIPWVVVHYKKYKWVRNLTRKEFN